MNNNKPKNNLSYEEALHGIQSATKYELETNGYSSLNQIKHLRVGIDSAHITDEAIARLLIRKGIITEEEYIEEIRICMNRELDRRESKYPNIKFR